MKLTENTKVRVKVPKHLYEAIQAELDKKHGMEEGHYGDKEMEEGDDYMEEAKEMNEYVGMSPDQVQAMELAGQILAAVAAGTGLTAGIVNLAKKVKSKIQSKSDKPEVTAEELEEVLDLNTLMEAVKDASKKKVEEKKKKELEAKKKKAEDDKKKEAEAKKKALKEDMKSDFEAYQSGKFPKIEDDYKEIGPDTQVPIGSSLVIKGRNTFFTLEKINGDKYTLSFDMDGEKFTKSRKQLEKYFLFKPGKAAKKK